MWSVNVMYASCHACKTVYPVSAAQLRAAGGRVRCGNCHKVFDATSALFDNPQQALAFAETQLREVSREIDDLVGRALDEVSTTEPSPEPDAEAVAPDLPAEIPGQYRADAVDAEHESGDKPDQSVSSQLDSTANVHFQADVDTYAAPVAAEFASSVSPVSPVEKEMPSAALLFETGPVTARTSWGAIAAGLLLTVLLLGQYVWVERYRMAGIPAFRPYLDVACGVLGCDLPLRHETARLEILEREIRNHPHVDDALLVNATFTNGADFVQSYPVFEVAFSDVSGTPVAVRRFLPSEYLNGVDPSKGMVPGQQTRLMVEIVDPGDRAVSFQFDFL